MLPTIHQRTQVDDTYEYPVARVPSYSCLYYRYVSIMRANLELLKNYTTAKTRKKKEFPFELGDEVLVEDPIGNVKPEIL